jgi:hypothetical protein
MQAEETECIERVFVMGMWEHVGDGNFTFFKH